jgi:hypothetical protein
MPRSEPGKGRRVEIHFLHQPVHEGDSEQELVWRGPTVVEDYADTESPVTVKIRQGYPRGEAARRLRELIEDLEEELEFSLAFGGPVTHG